VREVKPTGPRVDPLKPEFKPTEPLSREYEPEQVLGISCFPFRGLSRTDRPFVRLTALLVTILLMTLTSSAVLLLFHLVTRAHTDLRQLPQFRLEWL
jgi:hypothetical protein